MSDPTPESAMAEVAAAGAELAALRAGAASAGFDLTGLPPEQAPLDDEATAPLRFEPLVTAVKKEPAVYLELNGQRIAQWNEADVRRHAMHVLEVVAAVDLDAAYHRYLIGTIGLDDGRARVVVGDLGKHRGSET